MDNKLLVFFSNAKYLLREGKITSEDYSALARVSAEVANHNKGLAKDIDGFWNTL